MAILIGAAVPLLATAPIVFAVGLARGESACCAAFSPLMVALVTAGMASALGWRWANLRSRWLGVNATLHVSPLLALALLAGFRRIEDVNLLLLAVGALVVVGANTLALWIRGTAENGG